MTSQCVSWCAVCTIPVQLRQIDLRHHNTLSSPKPPEDDCHSVELHCKSPLQQTTRWVMAYLSVLPRSEVHKYIVYPWRQIRVNSPHQCTAFTQMDSEKIGMHMVVVWYCTTTFSRLPAVLTLRRGSILTELYGLTTAASGQSSNVSAVLKLTTKP